MYQKGKHGYKIYLPKKVINTPIRVCHQAYGHILVGAGKTYKIIEHFYYPRLAKITGKVLKECDSCQRNKIPTWSSLVIQKYIQPDKLKPNMATNIFS